MGGTVDFKVGYKTGFASGASGKKILYPTSPNVGAQASKYYYGPIEYIEICCLVVALINIEAKIIFIGPPPVPPVPRWSQKWGDMTPRPYGCTAHVCRTF